MPAAAPQRASCPRTATETTHIPRSVSRPVGRDGRAGWPIRRPAGPASIRHVFLIHARFLFFLFFTHARGGWCLVYLRFTRRLLARCVPFTLVCAPCALRIRSMYAPCALLFTSGFVLFTTSSGFVRFITSGFPAVSQGLTTGFSYPEKDPHSQVGLRPRQGRQ